VRQVQLARGGRSAFTREGECIIDDRTFYWNGHDTIACPTFPQVINRNTSMRKVACLLQVDDGPLQSKLGFYEEEPLLGA